MQAAKEVEMSNTSVAEAPPHRKVPQLREAAEPAASMSNTSEFAGQSRPSAREKGGRAWHTWVLEAYPDLG